MPLITDPIGNIPISFASVSIGNKTEHTLPKKIEAIANAGFSAIELGFPDLLTFAGQHLGHNVGEEDWDDLVVAAQVVGQICKSKGLSILILQPFTNFEGWPAGSEERINAFEKARGWMKIMKACGTNLLQVGSSDTPEEKIGNDRSRFVADLQELADLLATENLSIAYENWCWSTHAPDWKDVWDIVNRVNRPNIGLCLDTFQSAGGEYGDPTTESGMVQGQSAEHIEQNYLRSLEELGSTVPMEKIYLLQVSDAYRPRKPFHPDPDETGARPRARWSHDYRPLPYDGGYLPIESFAKAVLKTGFRSWFSYEVFDSGPDGKGKNYNLQDYANQAFQSHIQFISACAKQ